MGKPNKVIIDTDMGWDDILSLLYLMKNPTIEIIGITVTGCGETDLRWGTVIAKTLMELGNQTQVSVCIGASSPLECSHAFPQAFKNDMNDIMGLLGTINPKTNIDIDDRPAWQYLAETLSQTNDNITLLSLGGFTNIARMLEQSPDTDISKLDAIYAMAGAVYVDGNVDLLNNAQPDWDQGAIYATNHAAEWNVFIDPLAAKMVFESSIPITLIPLDACNHVILGSRYVNKITASDPIATLAKNIFKKKIGASNEGIPVPIFDPLATVIMAKGIKNIQQSSQFLDVKIADSEHNNQCGNTFVAPTGSRRISIVQGVSQFEFAEHYSSVINSEVLR